MKILSVCTSDVSGGAARAAYRIHQGVRSLGVDSRMFVKFKGSNDSNVHALSEFVPNNPIYNALDWCAAKVKNKIQHYRWNQYSDRDAYFKSDLRGTRIHSALQTLDYDILHLHWINNRFVNIKELSKINKPIIWTLHDSWPFCGVCHLPMDCKQYESHCGGCTRLGSTKEQDLAYKIFEQKQEIYKQLDLHIVTPSKWLAECAKRSALFGTYPISVIPNCVDTELYRPLDKLEAVTQYGLNPNKKYLLYGAIQATTDKNKGFDLLIDALKQLQDLDAELIVYGTDEDLSKYNIPIPVHSLGYIHGDKQMALLYNTADVMIVPSRSENLSNTIMESMSCGTPVVAFNIGGNSDLIDHTQNGYLAKERDCKDLARGIRYCIEDNTNSQLGNAARRSVLQRYSIGIIAQQYKTLYESLL